MSKKQWYVYTEGYTNFIHDQLVEYVPTKADADKLLKQVQQINKISWIDFVWKSSLNLPFTSLHGKNIKQVESILNIIN